MTKFGSGGWMVLAAGLIVAAGCGGQKAEQGAAHTDDHTHAPGEAAHGHDTPARPIETAGTINGVWQQIATEQQKMDAAIQAGQLDAVHHLAFGVRDLTTALAARMTGLSSEDATALGGVVAEIKDCAGRLDEYGDSGNLGKTKEQFARMGTLLEKAKALTSKGTMGAAAAPSGNYREVQLAGEIIDPQCFFTHDGRGPGHAACAERCARGGQGLSFLEDVSETVYPLIAKSHGENQNDGLYEHIGKPVTVKGLVFKKGSNAVLLILSVTAGPKG